MTSPLLSTHRAEASTTIPRTFFDATTSLGLSASFSLHVAI